MKAAASVTTPRMPAHPTRRAAAPPPAFLRWLSISGTRMANTQTNRTTMTVTSTLPQTRTIHPSGR